MEKSVRNPLLILTALFLAFNTGCSKPTKACFVIPPDMHTTNADVVFDATCSEMTSFYEWSFGDGTPDTTTSELTIAHRFENPGAYTVTLNAIRKDKAGYVRKGEPAMVRVISVQ